MTIFEGTVAYNAIHEINGKTYHLNFKKLICFISQGYYKEEFWSDKANKYFIRIFDFKNNELYQINIRYKTIVKSNLKSIKDLIIQNISYENQNSVYELKYSLDFGFKSTSKYSYLTDTGIYVELNNAEHIRICSKVPMGNNEIASYFKEEPSFRYRQAKEYKLVGINPKKVESTEFKLDKYKGFDIKTEKINRVISDNLWSASELKKPFDKRMIHFYENELNRPLTEEQKNNIAAYNSIYFGLLREDEYRKMLLKLRKFEEDYPL
jgi:hypothetical protein